jgi:hypothetical protein
MATKSTSVHLSISDTSLGLEETPPAAEKRPASGEDMWMAESDRAAAKGVASPDSQGGIGVYLCGGVGPVWVRNLLASSGDTA